MYLFPRKRQSNQQAQSAEIQIVCMFNIYDSAGYTDISNTFTFSTRPP